MSQDRRNIHQSYSSAGLYICKDCESWLYDIYESYTNSSALSASNNNGSLILAKHKCRYQWNFHSVSLNDTTIEKKQTDGTAFSSELGMGELDEAHICPCHTFRDHR